MSQTTDLRSKLYENNIYLFTMSQF